MRSLGGGLVLVDRTVEPVAEPGEFLLNGAIGYSGSTGFRPGQAHTGR
jgi:hypothetical protein